MSGPEYSVLVVEDDDAIRFSLTAALRREGFSVTGTAEGEEALQLLESVRPDLVLLDLVLPDLSGLDVCRLIRRVSQVPIIMVTARDAEGDVVSGLELGADDYVTKPFSLSVLMARVRANLRRGAQEAGAPGSDTSSVQVGTLEIDPESHLATAAGRQLELTPRLFQLLLYLARNAGRVCRRDELLDRVWGYDFLGETRTLDVHVHWLRERLAATDLVLETVRGIGYRLGVKP